MVVAFWNRYRERSCRRFAFTRARAALCRSFAALARSRSSCSGARGRGAGGNTARSDGADVGTLSWRGSMAPRTARAGIRVVGCASRNTKIAARPSVRFVKVYVEAYGCTQNYGEARLMQEALGGSGHTITTAEADADAHVLVTCTVVETTERKMARRMEELGVYEKPFVVAGCMAAAQRARVHPSSREPSCCRRESGRRSSSCSVRGRHAATVRRRSSRPHSDGGTRSSRSPKDARAVARIVSREWPADGSLRTPSLRSSRRSGGTSAVA